MKIIPPLTNCDSIDNTSTATPSSVTVDFLFTNNNIAYRVLELLEDNMYCDCVIVGGGCKHVWIEIATIQSIIDEQNKK